MKWDLALSFISGEVGPGLKDFITSELGPSLKIYLVNWYLVLKGGEGGGPDMYRNNRYQSTQQGQKEMIIKTLLFITVTMVMAANLNFYVQICQFSKNI